ncbi:MAG TPA: glycoside hydrolase family 76 protein [Amycolatopsis sp.]|jgi:predicted alpha-1,6-mannanase (GH76 family)|nr:glycoside hydrolase family 76 protein [Amycolatopsis sp.]
MDGVERAAVAERAVRVRHLRPVWGVPGTVLGRSGWPPTFGQRLHWHWNYWWQAHLLDTLVDAQLRDPRAERGKVIRRFVRSIHFRNLGKWTNDFYDDIAWLGLALQRVRALDVSDVDKPIAAIDAQLHEGWTDDAGGGIWWRRGDRFKNAPANGPAAIFHAREGDTTRAREMTAWLTRTLKDPGTGLLWDGIRADTGELVKHIFTYCQGVYLGACLELSELDEAAGVVSAVAGHLAPGGVIRGQNGGDGGLFGAILARYLALAAHRLTGPAAAQARTIVRTSADACWRGATTTLTGPLFSADWSTGAPTDPPPRAVPERDLSVQTGAWLLLEAAATL